MGNHWIFNPLNDISILTPGTFGRFNGTNTDDEINVSLSYLIDNRENMSNEDTKKMPFCDS